MPVQSRCRGAGIGCVLSWNFVQIYIFAKLIYLPFLSKIYEEDTRPTFSNTRHQILISVTQLVGCSQDNSASYFKSLNIFFFLQGSSDEIILKISASPKKVDLNKSPSKKPPQKASEAQDHWVDKCSRLLFPAMYSIFLIAYVIHYKNKIED